MVQKIDLKESATSFEVSANGINLTFDKITGLLQKAQNAKGIIPFTNGPVLQESVNNFKNFKRKNGERKSDYFFHIR